MKIGMNIRSGDAVLHFEAKSDDTVIAIETTLRHLAGARDVALMRLSAGAQVGQNPRENGRNPCQAPRRQLRPATAFPVPQRHTQVGYVFRQRRMPKAVGRQLRRDDVAGHGGCGLVGSLNRGGGDADPVDCTARLQHSLCRGRTSGPWPAPLLLSVNDYSACEFEPWAKVPANGSGALPLHKVRCIGLPGADQIGSGTGEQQVAAAGMLEIQLSLQAVRPAASAATAIQPIEERT